MDILPRDTQIEIIKHFDMDARIKTGIIGKLKVPENLKKTLEKLQIPKKNWDIYSVSNSLFTFMWNTKDEEKSMIHFRPNNSCEIFMSTYEQTKWFDNLYEYILYKKSREQLH